MKNNYFILFFILAFANVFAQVDVTINVADASSNSIANADVTLGVSTLPTDASGNVTFTGVTDGTYDVTISATCYVELRQSITVNGAPISVDYTLNALTTNDVFFFLGMMGAETGVTVNLNDGAGYNESYTAAGTPMEDVMITGVPYGTYTYTISKACSTPITGTVVVECNGEMGISIFGNNPTAITIDTSVTQNTNELTANEAGASYQWVDCNNGNAPIDGETNQTFTATVNGSYAVVITVGNCEATSSCTDITTLSADSFDSSLDLKLFPNPVVDALTINLNSSYEKIDIQVYSLLGQLVKTAKMTNGLEYKLNLSDLSAGSYVIKIHADGKTDSSLIIKK